MKQLEFRCGKRVLTDYDVSYVFYEMVGDRENEGAGFTEADAIRKILRGDVRAYLPPKPEKPRPVKPPKPPTAREIAAIHAQTMLASARRDEEVARYHDALGRRGFHAAVLADAQARAMPAPKAQKRKGT